MNRNLLIALVVAAAALAAGLTMCRPGETEPAVPAASAPPAPVDRTPAAPDQAVGDSCAVDCGGTPVAITCAEGEKPVCDCAGNPQSLCLPPAAATQP